MIFPNGTIETKIKSGGGFNNAGYPIKPDEKWSNPIQCHFRSANCNLNGIAKGESFTDVSYEIIIYEQSYEGEILKLRDSEGNVIGEYSAIKIDKLSIVGRIKILV